MPRAVIRWTIFALCLGVFFLAMAWVSVKTLRMEEERLEAEREAQVQERVRLALWRMDSLAGGLVIGENSRPAWHYRAFHSPRELFAKESQEVIPQGEALEPSPLLGEPPENVLLHFQMGPTVATCSPQVPVGADLSLTNQWYVVTKPMEAARQKLTELQALLGRHPDLIKDAQPTITDVPGLQRRPAAVQAPPAEAKKELSKADSAQMEYSNREQSQRLNVLTQTVQNANVENPTNKSRMMKVMPEPKPSKKLAANERAKGAPSFSKSSSGAKSALSEEWEGETKSMLGAVGDASSFKGKDEGQLKRKPASLADAGRAAPADKATGAVPPPPPVLAEAREAAAAAPAASSAIAPSAAPMVAGMTERDFPLRRNEGAMDEAPKQEMTLAEAAPSKVTEMQALWVESQLLLVRQATLDGTTRMQGVWVDWDHLQQSLLNVVKDLLPGARIQASTASRLDPMHLVMLPVRLIPGKVELPAQELELGRPLRRALGIAWLCFAGAAVAVGLVLQRTLALSERRGAFVSAVTHELRTPLTTFQLYSEMLAEGMVPEGEKRRTYLNTLCTEAKRLTHLVENVLAYSRIERGRTAGRQERLMLADLLRRMEPRLQQRAEQVDLKVRVLNVEEAEGIQLNLDPLAVEQILFNLVDNACKYAAPDCRERVIDLRIESLPKTLNIHVRDHGPGFRKAQMKKLFQPFAKSATEAAHSAPGVGLGLALCRQLARELGGELTLESNTGGASFCLKLPRMPDIRA